MDPRVIYFAFVLISALSLICWKMFKQNGGEESLLQTVVDMDDAEIYGVLWDTALFAGLCSGLYSLLFSEAPLYALLAVTAFILIHGRNILESHILITTSRNKQ